MFIMIWSIVWLIGSLYIYKKIPDSVGISSDLALWIKNIQNSRKFLVFVFLFFGIVFAFAWWRLDYVSTWKICNFSREIDSSSSRIHIRAVHGRELFCASYWIIPQEIQDIINIDNTLLIKKLSLNIIGLITIIVVITLPVFMFNLEKRNVNLKGLPAFVIKGLRTSIFFYCFSLVLFMPLFINVLFPDMLTK